MTPQGEGSVIDSFVLLTTSLVTRFDIVELLDELTSDCARLLDATSAGLMLADDRGVLHVMAASSEHARSLELFQLQREQGPCLDCYRTGESVSVPDLTAEASQWPVFVATARAEGFNSVHAIPLRLVDDVLGSLGLFGTETGSPDIADLRLVQAMAHVATVAIGVGSFIGNREAVGVQLRAALRSRRVVEQAKGILAQTGAMEMDEAFTTLRRYARAHDLRLTAVAEAVVTREVAAEVVCDARPSRPET